MYSVYILYSEKCDRYYIGYSSDVDSRLSRHNARMVPATRNCTPYRLMAFKQFTTELEAIREERRLKAKKSRIYLEWLLQGNW